MKGITKFWRNNSYRENGRFSLLGCLALAALICFGLGFGSQAAHAQTPPYEVGTDEAFLYGGSEIPGTAYLGQLRFTGLPGNPGTVVFNGNHTFEGAVGANYRHRVSLSGTGGAFRFQGGDFTYQNNRSGGNGGLFYIEDNSAFSITGTGSFISQGNVSDGNPSLDTGVYLVRNNSSLTINVGGSQLYQGDIVKSDNTAGGVFYISNATLDLRAGGDITFSGNNSVANVTTSNGGAIFANSGSTVNIDAASGTVSFSTNTMEAATNAYGGAIYNTTGSTTTITASNILFDGNGAISNGDRAFGGAIFNTSAGSNITLTGSTLFKENSATAAAGATSASGGAIYTTSGATTIFNGSAEFDTNTAKVDGAATGGAAGGAIYANSANTLLNFKNGVTFNLNSASTETGSATAARAAQGGAVFLGSGANMTVQGNATFTNNRAEGDTGSGGAVRANSSTVLALQGDTIEFSNNLAEGTNGSGSGGALYTGTSTVTLGNDAQTSQVIFRENTAQATSAASGGAVNNSGAAQTFTINGNVEFTQNHARSDGSTERVGTNRHGVTGGAVTNSGNITVSGTADFIGNEAVYSGTALANEGARGGAVNTSGTLTINGIATFSGNIANGGDGLAYGGAIYANNASRGSIIEFKSDARFTNNEAKGGAAVNGGAVSVIDPNSELRIGGEARFETNTATSTSGTANGGALHFSAADNSVTVEFSGDAIFDGNKADGRSASGGAASIAGNFSVAGDLTVHNNTAQASNGTARGGGFYFRNTRAPLSLTNNATFTDNKATSTSGAGQGGAIFVYESALELTPDAGNTITFAGNTASSTGGGDSIYLYTSANAVASNAALTVGGKGMVDVRDAMGGIANAGRTITINKTGTNTWSQGGNSIFAASGSGKTNFSVSGGILHLYGAGETADTPNSATIALNGAGSSFTLADGTTLSLGGGGHSITANGAGGSVSFNTGSSVNYRLGEIDDTGATAALSVRAPDLVLSNGNDLNFKINLDSFAEGKFTLMDSGVDGTFSGKNYSDTDLTLEQGWNNRISVVLKEDDGQKLVVEVEKIDDNAKLIWTGAQDTIWSNGGQENWKYKEPGETHYLPPFVNGDAVVFDETGAQPQVNVGGSGVNVAGMEVTGGDYTFKGGKISSSADDQTTLTGPDYTEHMSVSGDGTNARFETDLDFANGYEVGTGASMTFAGQTIEGDIDNSGSFKFDSNNNVTYSDILSGTGTFEKSNDGILFLEGDAHNATGDFKVSGGTLTGDFTYGGALMVANGATLAAGGVNAPEATNSSPIGTTTVGSAKFDSGSIFSVRIDGTNSDKLVSNADVVIEDGVRLVVNQYPAGRPQWKVGDNYQIIETAGTITGLFSGNIAPSELPFLEVEQLLTNGDKALSLVARYNPNSSVIDSATDNQRSTAAGIGFVPDGHDVKNAMVNSSGPEAFALLDQLSGEAHKSVSNLLGNRFRSKNLETLFHVSWAKARGTMGASGVDYAAGQAVPYRGNGLWADLSGSYMSMDGRPSSIGSANATLSGPEVALGYDLRTDDGWLAGTSVRYGDLRGSVDSRNSEADIASYSVSLYGGKEFDLGYGTLRLALGGAYAYDNIDMERQVNLGGLNQQLDSDYGANSYQVFTEAAYGYQMLDWLYMEPFAAAAWDVRRTGSFSENGGSAALRGASDRQDIGTSVLGLRGYVAAHERVSLAFELGWVHHYGNLNDSLNLSFSDASSSYGIKGAYAARDAAKVNVGAGIKLRDDLKMDVMYNGLLDRDASNHGGTLRLTWSW